MRAPTVQGAMRAALLLSLLLVVGAAPAAGAGAGAGERAPELSLPDLDGQTVALSSLRGSVVVLDFWASWCGPCKKELPALDALARRYAQAGKPVVVLAVNLDKERRNAEKLLATVKVSSLRVLLDPAGKVAAAYDLPTMPTSYVIDRRGYIDLVHAGYSAGDEKKLAARIDALLDD
jgi:thiol-disulfide isomerase/thioredoxin